MLVVHSDSARPADGDDVGDRLAAFLMDQGILEKPVVERAKRASLRSGERLDIVLSKLGMMSETDLAESLSRFAGIALLDESALPPSPILTDVIPPDFAKQHRLIPLKDAAEQLVLGVVDPFEDEPMRALSYLLGKPVESRLFVPSHFEKAYQALYQQLNAVADQAGETLHLDANDLDVERLRDLASEAPTIRLVNEIINEAVGMQASDIHLEPQIDELLVRYRVDGKLLVARSLASSQRASVLSRVKIMASLDIAERRLPQDGRIKIAVRGTDIDFRVSTTPTAFGESVVLRILDRSRVELDFEKLGFSPAMIGSLSRLIEEPNGIILVTGPTGSGKTTTLYTIFKALHSPDRKLFTVEDPIEYQLAGVNQIQVHPEIGLDFPHALRSILRQDPDIIMIGEIRDVETAQIAVQSSLTGHLVFSTLHTNSAAATITRLLDMGIESYLLASTVKAVLAQRLVRRLCRACSEAHPEAAVWESEISRVLLPIQPPNIRQARGCDNCNQTGFSGRTTIAELLELDGDVQSLILKRSADAAIQNAALEKGMMSMYADGLQKVWHGETTIDEVLRAARTG